MAAYRELPRKPGAVAEGGRTAGLRVGGARYILKRMLGRGPFSEVWLAWDRTSEQDVALKLLPQSLANQPNLLERLKEEARRCSAVTHPAIARVYDFVHDFHTVGIALEYVDGWSLAALKVDKPQHRYSLEEATPWIRQLCPALDYAHQAGLLHLDLKPSNLMLDSQEQLKITDFGLAWSLRGFIAETDPNRLAQTLPFMSPQQALGEKPSVLDDVYGLGATLYDLLTGTPPFYKGQVLAQICDRPPPRMKERLAELGIRDAIPFVVEDTVGLCLAKNPAERPQNISEVLRLLERSDVPEPVESAKVPAPEPTPAQPVTDPSPEQSDEGATEDITKTEPPEPEPILPRNPRTKLVFAAILLSSLVLIGLSALWWKTSRTKSQPNLALAALPDRSFNPGTNCDREIRVVLEQQDKKILIGGLFNQFGGQAHRGIARLNVDGSLDREFRANGNGDVHALAAQPDGKIIVAGDFARINGQVRRRIARLNPDGSVDETFKVDSGVNREIRAAAIQPDGKIIIAGSFDLVSGVKEARIARLNADGTRDGAFNPGAGASAVIWSIALQPDGKIVVGGDFTTFNNKRCGHVARLKSNGSLDASFDTGTGADAQVLAIARQTDGKILIGGDFVAVNQIERNHIARLNADGSVDSAFDPAAGPNSGVRCIAVQSDGKILVGGIFRSVQGVSRNRVARLNSNGTLDQSFDPGEGASEVVRWIGPSSSGKILVAGGFRKFADFDCARIVRLGGDSR